MSTADPNTAWKQCFTSLESLQGFATFNGKDSKGEDEGVSFLHLTNDAELICTKRLGRAVTIDCHPYEFAPLFFHTTGCLLRAEDLVFMHGQTHSSRAPTVRLCIQEQPDDMASHLEWLRNWYALCNLNLLASEELHSTAIEDSELLRHDSSGEKIGLYLYGAETASGNVPKVSCTIHDCTQHSY